MSHFYLELKQLSLREDNLKTELIHGRSKIKPGYQDILDGVMAIALNYGTK